MIKRELEDDVRYQAQSRSNDDSAKLHVPTALELREHIQRIVMHERDLVLHRSCQINPFSNDLLAYLGEALPRSEVTLWRSDIIRFPMSNADAYRNIEPDPHLLPLRPSFWYCYGGYPTVQTEEQVYRVAATVLIPSNPLQLVVVVQVLVDLNNAELDLQSMRLVVDGVIELGRLLGEQQGEATYACLDFMHSRVAQTQTESVDRPSRRRYEKANQTVPKVHVVQLRRPEPKQGETDRSKSPRDYSCQWVVKPHLRRPNSRMRVQRPIWVPAYVKGPADKPLKPKSDVIRVVKR